MNALCPVPTMHEVTPTWCLNSINSLFCPQICHFSRAQKGELASAPDSSSWGGLKARKDSNSGAGLPWALVTRMWAIDAVCLPEPPHMASPCGCLASSQSGGRVPGEAVQIKAEVRAWHFCDLASLPLHPLGGGGTTSAKPQGEGTQAWPWDDCKASRCIEGAPGMGYSRGPQLANQSATGTIWRMSEC